MEHYEEVLKLLHDKFDWNLTDSLTTTGEKLVADTIKALKIAENNQALQLQQTGVSVRFLLVHWVNANPIIDGAIYFDTREDCLKYWESLPKINGIEIEYTICRIKNVH
jgi:hypothetical protein